MDYEVKNLLPPFLYNDIMSVARCGLSLDALKGKTVMITGARDTLGFYLVCALLINNDLNLSGTKIVAVDSSQELFECYGKLTYRSDVDFIVSDDYSFLNADEVDCVIHTQKAESLSKTAGFNLIRFILEKNAHAVTLSPAEVYGEVFNGKNTIGEEDMGYINPADPKNDRITAERVFESLALNSGADIIIARCEEIFGAYWDPSTKLDSAFRDISGSECHASLPPSCYKKKGLCYVTDAAVALLTILLNGEEEIYNISSGITASIADIYETAGALFSNKEISVVPQKPVLPHSPMDANILSLDFTKLSELCYTPKITFQNGIVRTVKLLEEMGGSDK